MDAKVPLIVVVQFQQDFFCNPPKYPHWYGLIYAAVQNADDPAGFFFLNLSGDHGCAEKLATHSGWEYYGPELHVVWPGFWTAVTGD